MGQGFLDGFQKKPDPTKPAPKTLMQELDFMGMASTYDPNGNTLAEDFNSVFSGRKKLKQTILGGANPDKLG